MSHAVPALPSTRLRWGLAGSLLLHGLLLAWLLPRNAGDDTTPLAAAVAMEVELAPLPSAPPPRDNAPEPRPVQDTPPPLPTETPTRIAPRAALPQPTLPLLPRAANGDVAQPADATPPPPAPPQASAAPSLALPRIDNAAAPQQAATTLSESALPADWRSRLLGQLERYRRYPASARIRGQEGQPWLRVRLDRRGRVLQVELAQSSGVATLDAEALALPARAAPLPAPPDDLPGEVFELVLPIAFALQR